MVCSGDSRTLFSSVLDIIADYDQYSDAEEYAVVEHKVLTSAEVTIERYYEVLQKRAPNMRRPLSSNPKPSNKPGSQSALAKPTSLRWSRTKGTVGKSL